MEKKTKERLKTIGKVLVSLALISYVVYRAGPTRIYGEVVGADKMLFLLVLVIAVIKIAISARKWQILLKAKGEVKSFLKVWKLYYVGTFFNLFLPTNVGGDIVKAHKMSKSSERSVEAYSSVFMERFTGLVAILSLAVVSSLLYFQHLSFYPLAIIYLLFLPLMLLAVFLLSKKRYERGLEGLMDKVLLGRNPFSLKDKVVKLYRSVHLYTKKKRALMFALIISFVFHTLLIMSNFILGLSIGMDVPVQYFFIFIPITAVLLFLPISIRGFGVREVLYVFFFTQVGATAAQAVSLSFLVQIVNIISSLIGGGVYLLSQTEG